MNELDELMNGVRALAARITRAAANRLLASADPGHVQAHYVASALRLLEDAELLAILAAAGDTAAMSAIESVADEMLALREQLRQEPGDQAAGEAER